MRDYFVTGGTGAIGSALVPVLLEDPGTRVRLLIRARSREQVAARLDELFRFWNLEAAEPDARVRVSAVAGDATLPRLGLDPETFDELGRCCTHIVHSAGNVRMNLPLEKARDSAVASAESIVALAELCRSSGQLEKLEFVSTVGVAGRRLGLLPETWLETVRTFHNTYEQAKAEAEEWLRAHLERSPLPVTVHRPSMVVGDSRSGRSIHLQVFFHLCEFLSGRRTRGLVPSLGSTRLDIVPCDYVARLIAWSSRRGDTAGRVLHACSGPEGSILLERLQEYVRAEYRSMSVDLPPLRSVPPAIFALLLHPLRMAAPRSASRAVAALPNFLAYLADDQAFANQQTRALTGSSVLSAPPVAEYLARVLKQGIIHASRWS